MSNSGALEREIELQNRLKSVSLIAELEVETTDIAIWLDEILELMRSGNKGYKQLRELPATFAVTVTGIAALNYQKGDLWTGFLSQVQNTYAYFNSAQEFWGPAFIESLEALGLDTFDEMPLTYVGPILMHTGVPDYCLFDFFGMVVDAARIVGNDAEAVVHYIKEHEEIRYASIDLPARRLIKYGGEYATDFVERVLTFIASVKDDSAMMMETQLPSRIKQRALEFCDATRDESKNWIKRRAEAKMGVFLEPNDSQVNLFLPGFQDRSDISWNIDLDLQDQTPLTPRPRYSGFYEGCESELLPITQPIKRLGVKENSRSPRKEIELCPEEAKVIFFAESGKLISPKVALPRGNVWCLYEESIRTRISDVVVRQEVSPIGWESWKLELLDLSNVDKLDFDNYSVSIHNTRKVILKEEPSTEIFWGQIPVQSKNPSIIIPRGSGESWNISIVESDSSKVIYNRQVSSSTDVDTTVDTFDRSENIFGRYIINVRGPLGRGLSKEVAVISNIRLEKDKKYRRLTKAGLEPVKVRIVIDKQEPLSTEIEFSASDIEKTSLVELGENRTELKIKPLAMAVSLMRDGVPGVWNYSRINVFHEETANSFLYLKTIDLPLCDVYIQSKGETVQLLRPLKSSNEQRFVYDLSELGSTISEYHTCDLYLGNPEAEIRICRIAPKKIASGFSLNGNVLTIREFDGGEIEFKAWSLFEPWEQPEIYKVPPDGLTNLSLKICRTGSIAVEFARSDPWIPSQFSDFPTPGKVEIIHDPQVRHDPANFDSITNFILGISNEKPELTPDKYWRLFDTYYKFERLLGDDVVRVKEVLEPKDGSGLFYLENLVKSRYSLAEKLNFFILSGIAWTSKGSGKSPLYTDSEMLELLRADSYFGLLLCIPSLSQLEALSERYSSMAEIRHSSGQSIENILCSGKDEFREYGSFGGSTPQINDRAELVSELSLGEARMLDGQMRISSALKLLKHRELQTVRSASKVAEKLFRLMQELFKKGDYRLALENIEARVNKNTIFDWEYLSALSIGFGYLSRMAYRNTSPDSLNDYARKFLSSHREEWLSIAKVAPELVAIDLIIAEASFVRDNLLKRGAQIPKMDLPDFSNSGIEDR